MHLNSRSLGRQFQTLDAFVDRALSDELVQSGASSASSSTILTSVRGKNRFDLQRGLFSWLLFFRVNNGKKSQGSRKKEKRKSVPRLAGKLITEVRRAETGDDDRECTA